MEPRADSGLAAVTGPFAILMLTEKVGVVNRAGWTTVLYFCVILCVICLQSRCSVTMRLSSRVKTVAAWSWHGNVTVTTIASTCLTSGTATSHIVAATAGRMSSSVPSFASVFIDRGSAMETTTARITPTKTCLDVRTFCFLVTVTDLTLLMYALL